MSDAKKRERDARYREVHKSEIKAYKDAWYLRNKESVKARARTWELDHPKETRARQAKWRETHQEKEKIRHEMYRREHRKEIAAKGSEYRKSRAHECPGCGCLIDYAASRCRSCAKKGPLHPAWKGGKIKSGQYRAIYMPTHPMASKQGYVHEHRFIMATLIDRPVRRGEVVHHVNLNKADNHPLNLALCNNIRAHVAVHRGELYLPI